MLNKLINKKSLTVLGLNSGTSADGLDMAVVEIKRNGRQKVINFICGFEKKYPIDIKTKIEKLMYQDRISLNELIDFHNQLGKLFGRWSKSYIERLSKRRIKIDLIASHGQTIRHLPKSKGMSSTLQIASPEFIATKTVKVVVSDFRQAEIALGGEGAPITVLAVHQLLSQKSPKLIVNIGGISNYYYFPGKSVKSKIDGADCGPGNSLIDLLCQKLYKKNYDVNGSLAKKGKISKKLLSILMQNRFFKGDLKSTGKEIFGRDIIKRILKYKKQLKLSKEDILATAGEMTARSIYLSILPIIKKNKKIKKLYLTGGGRKNIFIKNRLSEYLPQLHISVVEELNIDGDFLEASAYAIMGEATIRAESMSLYRSDNKTPILGKISQPPMK